MKIVIASDSYKGSLSSKEVGVTIKKGINSVHPKADITVIPIGDGGEGTVEAMVDATNGHCVTAKVYSPIMERIVAEYGISGDGETAFVEMATASGLCLVPACQRNPYTATTLGTGHIMKSALDAGVKRMIIGIGGSATNDGGIGVASALGVRFLDEHGEDIAPTNQGIESLDDIDISGLDPRIKDVEIIVACDVNNPLTGENGASAIYGPQKGADAVMVKKMDANLKKFAQIVKRDVGIDIDQKAGAGAAGGLGAGLLAFFGADLKSGIDIVLDYLDFDSKIADADLVITGEGCFDYQTVMNKAPYGVARAAGKHNIKVIGISAVFGEKAEALLENGFDAIFSVVSKLTDLNDAILATENNLYILAKSIGSLI